MVSKVVKFSFKYRLIEVSYVDNLSDSLDPDQDRQNVGPDLDHNCVIPLKKFLKTLR